MPLGHVDVPQHPPDVHVLAHGAADERDLAVEVRGGVDDLLDAVDVRGEARDDDPPARREKTRSRLGPTPASLGEKPGGRRSSSRRTAAGRPRCRARPGADVRGRALDRGLVELVVAGDEHGAELGRRRHGARVGDRVRHVQQLDVERAELEPLARVDVGDVGLAEAVLVELGARHGRRQRTAEDRQVLAQLAQDPGQRPEVVLVAVGDDDALDVVDPRAQVAEVGQHQVDADHLGGREAQPDVDDEDPALVLEDHHVLADLAQPAEREDAERAGH